MNCSASSVSFRRRLSRPTRAVLTRLGTGRTAVDVSSRRGLVGAPGWHGALGGWPAYLTFALTALLLVVAVWRRLPPMPWLAGLLAVEVLQIAVGLVQARTGLPPFLVGAHMVLAALLVAGVTATLLAQRR